MFEFQVAFAAAERVIVSFTHVDDGETVVIEHSNPYAGSQHLGLLRGLLPGDLLVAINGKSVPDFSSAFDMFRAHCFVVGDPRSFLVTKVEESFSASFRRLEDGDAGIFKIFPLRQTVLRWREMVNRTRSDVVSGFIRTHTADSTQCPDDVRSVIDQFYFSDSDLNNSYRSTTITTPLLTACEYGYHRVVRALLATRKINMQPIMSKNIGCWNINTQNACGMAALHFAAQSGSR